MRPWPCILNYDPPLIVHNEDDDRPLNDIILPESELDFNYMHRLIAEDQGINVLVGILDYDILTDLYTVYEIYSGINKIVSIYYADIGVLHPTEDLRDLSVLESNETNIIPKFYIGSFVKIVFYGHDDRYCFRSARLENIDGDNYEVRLLQPMEDEQLVFNVTKTDISNFRSDEYILEYLNFIETAAPYYYRVKPLISPPPFDPEFNPELLLGLKMRFNQQIIEKIRNIGIQPYYRDSIPDFYNTLIKKGALCFLNRGDFRRIVFVLDYLVILDKYVVRYVHEYCDPTFLYVRPEELVLINPNEYRHGQDNLSQQLKDVIAEEVAHSYSSINVAIPGLDPHPPVIFNPDNIQNRIVPSGVEVGDIVNVYCDNNRSSVAAIIMEILPDLQQNGALRIPKYKINLLYPKKDLPSEYIIDMSNLRLIRDEQDILYNYFVEDYNILINRQYIRPNKSNLFIDKNIMNILLMTKLRIKEVRYFVHGHDPIFMGLDVFNQDNEGLAEERQLQIKISNERLKYQDQNQMINKLNRLYFNQEHIDAYYEMLRIEHQRRMIEEGRLIQQRREQNERQRREQNERERPIREARERELRIQREARERELRIQREARETIEREQRIAHFKTVARKAITDFDINNPPQVIEQIVGINCIMSANDISQLPPSNIWMGWDKNDYVTLHTDNIFNGNLLESYFCPICLGWGRRSKGCLYLNHSCSFSGWFHKHLHARFAEYGKVATCVDCCRITSWGQGAHKHFKLSPVNKTSKTTYEFGYVMDDNCLRAGGGSLLEKAARIQKMADILLELMPQRGKITQNEVKVKVVEGCWLAYPQLWTDPDFRERVFTLLRDQRIVFPEELLFDAKPTSNANNSKSYNTTLAQAGIHYEAPIVRNMQTEEYNYLGAIGPNNNTPIVPGIILRHKSRDADGNFSGSVIEHPIMGAVTLPWTLTNSGYTGKCPFYDICNGLIWPQEAEIAANLLKEQFPDSPDNFGLTDDYVLNYKRKFIELNPNLFTDTVQNAPEGAAGGREGGGAQVGGGNATDTDSMYVHLVDETCDLPSRKVKTTKGGTRRRGKAKGKTRGNGLRGTRTEGSRQAKPGSKSELPTKGWERGCKKRRQTKKN